MTEIRKGLGEVSHDTTLTLRGFRESINSIMAEDETINLDTPIVFMLGNPMEQNSLTPMGMGRAESEDNDKAIVIFLADDNFDVSQLMEAHNDAEL